MERMDHDDLFVHLKEAGDFLWLYEVRHFRGYRRTPWGDVQRVEIEILDAGPGEPGRYQVIATDDTGRRTSGKCEPHLEAAIASVSWLSWQGLDHTPSRRFGT
jgi:hypothetical protein